MLRYDVPSIVSQVLAQDHAIVCLLLVRWLWWYTLLAYPVPAVQRAL